MSARPPVVLVIASVLKPVNDVRMYKKFGKSLDRTGKYLVNIVGFQSQTPPTDSSVLFHPIFRFSRLHWKRLFANYYFYRSLKKIAPTLIILTTPELYPAVWWYRKKHEVSLVYDIVENYGRNLRYNQGFAAWIIQPLYRMLTMIERRFRRDSSRLLAAEQGYIQELSLASSSVTVLENKTLKPANPPPVNRRRSAPLSIIYTGTVSEVYGIWQALRVVQSLVSRERISLTFTVLGHVPQAPLHQSLRAYARRHPWLILRTQDYPVPHDAIIALIQQADLGVVSHQPVPSIAHCFPTRIWEYMAYRLPFLLQDHPYWTNFCAPWDCAIPIDFNHPSLEVMEQKILTGTFYSQGVPETIYWETEEKKLIDTLAGVVTDR